MLKPFEKLPAVHLNDTQLDLLDVGSTLIKLTQAIDKFGPQVLIIGYSRPLVASPF